VSRIGKFIETESRLVLALRLGGRRSWGERENVLKLDSENKDVFPTLWRHEKPLSCIIQMGALCGMYAFILENEDKD
jgi:hypothetical protein